MKIIRVSTFDYECYKPVLIDLDMSLNAGTAARIVCYLNAIDPHGPHYFRAVEDDDRTVEHYKDPRE